MFTKRETSQKMTLTLLFFLSWLCLSRTSSAFDITNILGHHPELSTFSNYLTQTQLTHDINSRQSITLLAIANSDMGPLSGKPMEQIEKIMAVHVLLGYYDLAKLKKLQGSTLTVPTLLRSNSIDITVARGGIVAFGSTRAQLVRTVESDPYTISVLQINSPIIPCGGLLAPRRSRRALAESPAQSPSQNNEDKHASPPLSPPPQASHPPSDSHSNHSDSAPSPQHYHGNAPPPQQQQQHDNGAPPPSNSDDNNKNAPQPSDDNNSSSSPPLSAENNNSSPSPSSDDSSSPSPQDDNADSPDSDDDEKKKDSPPSPAPPKGDDSPSSGPSSDSPSSAPTDDDTPNSEDDEKKRKNSAGGISPSSTGWIGVIVISVILGKMV